MGEACNSRAKSNQEKKNYLIRHSDLTFAASH